MRPAQPSIELRTTLNLDIYVKFYFTNLIENDPIRIVSSQ